MAEGDWDRIVKRAHEVCALCEKELLAGEDVVTTLALGDGGVLRRDLHPDCFAAEDVAPLALWRWRRGRELKPDPRRLDLAFLTEFFKRLDGKTGDHERRVAWIVTLLLLRKKLLEEVSRTQGADGEILSVRLKKTERVYEVPDPNLTPDDMATIEDDLARLFNLGGTAETPAPTDGAATD
jgi:hypothetical protein